MDHKHKYKKLNDRAVFCAGCGDIRVEPIAVAPCPGPHWYFDWTYRPVTIPYTVPTFVVTSGTTSVYDLNDKNVTYTVQS